MSHVPSPRSLMPARPLLAALLLLAAAPEALAAQAVGMLPSAEQVLADWHAAAGGVERLARLRDGVYRWEVDAGGRTLGTAHSLRVAPGSLLETMPNGATNAFTPDAVWRRRADGTVTRDTSAASHGSRLQAALEATHLVNLGAQGITARVIGADTVDGERAWRVEFARGDARSLWLFGAGSKRPLRILVNEARGISIRYADFRTVDGVLEPHRVTIAMNAAGGGLVFRLQEVRYDTGLSDRDFLPPAR